jgi:hypothetical protein
MSRSPRIKEIVANRILLKTPRGKLRVVLDASSDDATFVQLHDGRNPRLVMCIDSDGNPKLVFWNKTGSPAISMGIADEFCGVDSPRQRRETGLPDRGWRRRHSSNRIVAVGFADKGKGILEDADAEIEAETCDWEEKPD